MKGMTSGSFIFTAPCAADSSSIPTGICTPDYCSYKSTESLDNKHIERFSRKVWNQPCRIPGVIGRRDAPGLPSSHPAVRQQSGWLDSHEHP